ncbi:MAG: hypothetical protein AB1394_09615 [Bacteroidota bacterium]
MELNGKIWNTNEYRIYAAVKFQINNKPLKYLGIVHFDKDVQLKKKLDEHYNFFDRTKISPVPLEYPHKFT